jgi:hypothetical protein
MAKVTTAAAIAHMKASPNKPPVQLGTLLPAGNFGRNAGSSRGTAEQ